MDDIFPKRISLQIRENKKHLKLYINAIRSKIAFGYLFCISEIKTYKKRSNIAFYSDIPVLCASSLNYYRYWCIQRVSVPRATLW